MPRTVEGGLGLFPAEVGGMWHSPLAELSPAPALPASLLCLGLFLSSLVDPAALSVLRALSRAALSLSVKDTGSRFFSRRINRMAFRFRLRSGVVSLVASLVFSGADADGANPRPCPPVLTTVA